MLVSNVVILPSDLGSLRLWLVTVRLSKPLTEDLISKLRDIVDRCGKCVLVIVPASKVLNYWHMIYPSYLSLRDFLRGNSRYKDPGLGALAYMAGTDQVKKALRQLSPIGHRDVSILIMGLGDDALKVIDDARGVLMNLVIDMFIGVGAYKLYDGVWRDIEDFMTALLMNYLRGYT